MGKKKPNTDVEKLSFEQAIEALTAVVRQIEDGRISLSESLDKYEHGMALIRHCRRILTEAEKRIETIGAEAETKAEAAEDVAEDIGDEGVDGGDDEGAEEEGEALF